MFNSTLKLLIVMAVGFLSVVGVLVASYISAHNYGAATEQQIIAKHLDNMNVLSNYSVSIAEMVQVPDLYVEDLKAVVKADLEGRYGPNGSQATFQWIQERNLPFDSSLYNRVSNAMEAGRKEFATSQRGLLDLKRGYQTSLDLFWTGKMLAFAGYPKIALDSYGIILTNDTRAKFESGVDTPIQINRESEESAP